MSRIDNSDYQPGMPLPSRKETHARKKGKSKKREELKAQEQLQEQLRLQEQQRLREQEQQRLLEHQPPAEPDQAAQLRELQASREEEARLKAEREAAQLRELNAIRAETKRQLELRAVSDEAAPLQELQAAQEQVAATAAVLTPADVPSEPARTEDEDDEETEPVIGKWTYRLLLTFVPILLLLVLAYGKLGYVHQVPDLVRQNVTAYEQGEGFLILKPWWFGPPVYKLDSYLSGPDTTFPQYQLNLHDFAAIVDQPIVLWRFQDDFLQK